PGCGQPFVRAIKSALTSPSTRIFAKSVRSRDSIANLITSHGSEFPDACASVSPRFHFVIRPRRTWRSALDQLLSVRDDIAAALVAGAPVVALESTVIAHGLPRPHNLDTALEMEAVVREAGATPATIGLLDGKIVVGLKTEQIARLADATDVAKVSS